MMNGKVVLITGGTNGIGKIAAQELAKQGATVVIVGRNAEKTRTTVEDIRAQSGSGSVESLLADLSSLAEVRRLANEFRQRHQRLDVLINNAGAYFAQRGETVDGFERTFALNHLSYFLLTNLLIDLLEASVPSRIINVASDAHQGAKLNFDDLQNTDDYGRTGFRAYGQSKLANILFSYALARRLDGTGVTVNALHPGLVATGFGHNNGGLASIFMRLMSRFSLTPEQGAETIVYLATAPEVEGVTGKYWTKNKAVGSSKASYDEAAQKRLWDVSAAMTGLGVAAIG
jgi:NAD(P)-dependent dehydrogenase (short-subunit alcohol dehydrogenase family)